MRSRFQGVWNIVRFNWHFFVGAGLCLILGLLLSFLLPDPAGSYLRRLSIAAMIPVAVSLFVSWYVYDRSRLYDFKWLETNVDDSSLRVANIHAGFDETSRLLDARFPRAKILVFDFYDPLKHTEVSIRRARKASPPFPGTKAIATQRLPLDDASMDHVVLFLAAHEIRDEDERVTFFREIHRVLKPTGKAHVSEHLRDLPNFLAYNIGFFHFIPKLSWYRTFDKASLKLSEEIKHTPFITTFVLRKDGITP